MKRPTLGAIFLTVFLDLLGFGIVIPYLAAEARDTFHTSEAVATLLGSVYSLMQFLFVPVWGRLSDRVGRRPVLLWSIFGTALSMTGLGLGLMLGGSVLWLFLARGLGGIATANLGIASACIADVTKPEDRARGMGLFGAAFGLGFILGPGIGGVLAGIPIMGRMGPLPCFVAAALSLVNLIWAYFGLRESLPKESRKASTLRSLAPLNREAIVRAFSHPGVALAILVNFLMLIAFTNLDQTFAFFCHDRFGIDRRGTGYVLAMVGLIAAFVQGGLMRPLSRRFSEASLMRAGIFLQAMAFALLALSPAMGRPALYGAMGLLAFGNGLSAPATSAYISKRAPIDEQGSTLGTNQSFASLARTLGPALSGYLYTAMGTGAPYVAGSVGMLVALVVALRLPRGAQR